MQAEVAITLRGIVSFVQGKNTIYYHINDEIDQCEIGKVLVRALPRSNGLLYRGRTILGDDTDKRPLLTMAIERHQFR